MLVRVDGTDRTVTPGPASEPTWSPSADRVAYIERGEQPRLLLLDGAGSEQYFLTDRFSRIQQLAYSPTGTHLAFAAAERPTDQLDVWTIRVDDGQLQRLTEDPVDDFGPTWSAAVADRIAERVASVERMPGRDRYETSTRAADLAVANGASAVRPWLVTGRDWPDALVAAPAVARDGGVLLLVDGRDPVGSTATHAWLPGRETARGVVVGGTAAITPAVRAAIESSLVSGP